MQSEFSAAKDVQEIRQMMERSSKFISLSGLSGIAAGICALIGAYFGWRVIDDSPSRISGLEYDYQFQEGAVTLNQFMGSKLLQIAFLTFIAAFITAFIFTFLKSRKTGQPIWGVTSRRLLTAVLIPMVAGGIYLLAQIHYGHFGLIAPGSLIFYGLGLIGGSRYTVGEIRYLGYLQILLGVVSSWYPGYGIYFWAMGFGVCHIAYGIIMWIKYDLKRGHAESD
jgi:hypothetical protein